MLTQKSDLEGKRTAVAEISRSKVLSPTRKHYKQRILKKTAIFVNFTIETSTSTARAAKRPN